MRSLSPRLAAALVGLGLALTSCSFDEAALARPGADQVAADVGELRVLTYEDDPATDAWVDAITPDPAVFTEDSSFREADSRTPEPDETAELRRLFTAAGTGRTLLVVVNCDPCVAGDNGIHVWDLVVGDPAQEVTSATGLAQPDEVNAARVGELIVTARTDGGPTSASTVDGDGDVTRVARHEPDDGADLFVDVYVATAPGPVTLVQETASGPVTYRFEIT